MAESPIDLPRAIYAEAMELRISAIFLRFSGGSDQGYLSVEVVTDERNQITAGHADYQGLPLTAAFIKKVDAWADAAYKYNGAGDGVDYGDDIMYNLVANRVIVTDWQMERVDNSPCDYVLKIEKKSKKETDSPA